MDRVKKRRYCKLPLKKMNIIGPTIEQFDITDYVYSEKYLSNKKYWLINALSFIGFFACIACIVLLFM